MGSAFLTGRAQRRRWPPIPKRARLRKLHADLVSEYTRAAAKCLPHRAFLESLNQEQAA